jgi:hypothetical protein
VKSDLNASGPTLPASISGTLTPSPTGNVSGTPTPTSKISPTPTKAASAGAGGQVLILTTPTGFLNVRSTPGGATVGQVNPGQTFSLLDEQVGWYQIQLSDGTKGWVSGQYAKKQ